MPFPSTIGFQQAFGLAGEFAYDAPKIVQPGMLNSADPTLNVFGNAAVILAGATGSFPVAGDNGVNPKAMSVGFGVAGLGFAGIMVDPKEHFSNGTVANGPLAASYVLPNNVIAGFCKEGYVTVNLPAASAPNDVVYYTTATGALVTAAPGVAIPGGAAGPIGTVERFVNAAASLAVIHLEPRVPSVAP